jgi:hypothetical protein
MILNDEQLNPYSVIGPQNRCSTRRVKNFARVLGKTQYILQLPTIDHCRNVEKGCDFLETLNHICA